MEHKNIEYSLKHKEDGEQRMEDHHDGEKPTNKRSELTYLECKLIEIRKKFEKKQKGEDTDQYVDLKNYIYGSYFDPPYLCFISDIENGADQENKDSFNLIINSKKGFSKTPPSPQTHVKKYYPINFMYKLQEEDFKKVYYSFLKSNKDCQNKQETFFLNIQKSPFLKKQISEKNITHHIKVYHLNDDGFILDSFSVSPIDFTNDTYRKDIQETNKRLAEFDREYRRVTYKFRLQTDDYFRVCRYFGKSGHPSYLYHQLWNAENLKRQIELNNIQHDMVVYKKQNGLLIDEYPVDLESFKNDSYLNNPKKEEIEESKYELSLSTFDYFDALSYYMNTNRNFFSDELFKKRMKNREYLKYLIDKKVIQKNIFALERKDGRVIKEHVITLENFKKDNYEVKQEKLDNYKFGLRPEDCKRVWNNFISLRCYDDHPSKKIFYDKLNEPNYLKEQIKMKNIQNEITVFELNSGVIKQSYYVSLNDFISDVYRIPSKYDTNYYLTIKSREDYSRVKNYHLKTRTKLEFDKLHHKLKSHKFIRHQIDLQNIQNDIEVVIADKNGRFKTYNVSPENVKLHQYLPTFKEKVYKGLKNLLVGGK